MEQFETVRESSVSRQRPQVHVVSVVQNLQKLVRVTVILSLVLITVAEREIRDANTILLGNVAAFQATI